MSVYTPDRWVVVEFSTPTETYQKVFAGWYGGFAGSDSWKLNSGITEIRRNDLVYEFDGYTGSTYVCHERGYGMSSYMMAVYGSWLDQTKLVDDVKIRILDLEDIKVS